MSLILRRDWLPANGSHSLLGGALMVAAGVLYLAFEDLILADFSTTAKSKFAMNHVTRGLMGIQLGLIVLAMLVTRSSAFSLPVSYARLRAHETRHALVCR